MKTNIKKLGSFAWILTAVVIAITLNSCSPLQVRSRGTDINLSAYIRPGEPLAIMPFETESALSNLGGLVSDEVTANLLENVKNIKIIPTTITRSFLQNSNISVSGIPDYHTVHSISQGLKCRYLLAGNFYSSIGEVRYTSTYSSRIATGSVTVRLIDCDSGTVIWAKHVQDSFQTTTYYSANANLPTSYFTDGQLLQELIRRLGADVAQYFYRNE